MQNCEICTKMNLWSSTGQFVDGRRQFRCRNCGHVQVEVPPQGLMIAPKVFYFDIETSLFDVQVFSLMVYSKRIRVEHKVNDWYIICWAGAWIENNQIISVIHDKVTVDEARERNDFRSLQKLWAAMDKADYIVGHNSDKFDVKKAHSRFIANDMGLPYKSIQKDTLKIARKYFAEDSNRLDHWIKKFGGEGKVEMEHEDWERINRDPKAKDIKKMDTYCMADVERGAKVFIEMNKLIEARGERIIK